MRCCGNWAIITEMLSIEPSTRHRPHFHTEYLNETSLFGARQLRESKPSGFCCPRSSISTRPVGMTADKHGRKPTTKSRQDTQLTVANRSCSASCKSYDSRNNCRNSIRALYILLLDTDNKTVCSIWNDLEGRSRSRATTQFDRSHITFY